MVLLLLAVLLIHLSDVLELLEWMVQYGNQLSFVPQDICGQTRGYCHKKGRGSQK